MLYLLFFILLFLFSSRYHHVPVMSILDAGNQRLLCQRIIPFTDGGLHLFQICFQAFPHQQICHKTAGHRQNGIAFHIQNRPGLPLYDKADIKLSMKTVYRVFFTWLRLANNQNRIFIVHYVSPFLLSRSFLLSHLLYQPRPPFSIKISVDEAEAVF